LKINLNEILYAFSSGLDAVETELLGTTPGHSKRVAAISIMTGKALGLSENELIDLAAFSILHDNSLTEVDQEQQEYAKYNGGDGYTEQDFNIRRCTIGENNTKFMPFRTNNRDVILLHHENADGSGPFGRGYEKTPIKAQIIHLAVELDNKLDIHNISKDTYGGLIYFVKSNTGTLFSKEVADAFTGFFKHKHLTHLTVNNIDNYLRKATKHFSDEYSFSEIMNLATLFARIIDYKSHYTCRHSIGVAENAKIMATYYNYPKDKLTKYYLAGALHDVGKLKVSNAILQKPGKLTDDEYEKMKTHAYYTYDILKHVKNMDDIMIWASHHHEKLNGEGYPFGIRGEDLSQEERLMTCCDIYQALAEERPYKPAFPHEKVISIMREMVVKGEIDNKIVNDMDVIFRDIEEANDAQTTVLKQ